MIREACAFANANIALVKYWGKCDDPLNLPAAPSLSFTLHQLGTYTRVRFDPAYDSNQLWINGVLQTGEATQRVFAHLSRLTERKPTDPCVHVYTRNALPTASGLASSASGFAALTLAATAAWFGPERTKEMPWISTQARQGSASAARSLLGGLVVLSEGQPGDNLSSRATQILAEDQWPDLQMVLGVLDEGPKPLSSTQAMNHTRQSSIYYDAFLRAARTDVAQAIDSIHHRDLEQLGDITECSALRMHAALWGAHPGIVYFRGVTLEALHAIRALRTQGHPAWFTCDAGPHPKVLTNRATAALVGETLQSIPSIRHVLFSSLGAAARLCTECP